MDRVRQKCIDCAIQLCSSQGLDFTMSQLAAQLGMSKKTLYVLFDSKEALLLAAVDTMFDAVKADEAKILARQDLSLADKVRQLVVVLPDSYKNLDWSRLQGVEEKYPAVYGRIRQRLESEWEPTLELLRQYRPKGILHCFSGSVEMAREVTKLGMYLGIGGVVTFKNARVLKQVVQAIDLELLVLETDAPYMAPEPLRGQTNRSDYILYIARQVAQLKNLPVERVLQITEQNARRLFQLEQNA